MKRKFSVMCLAISMFAFSLCSLLYAGESDDYKNPLKLQLPSAIYANVGIESNVYFDNIVLTINSSNYVFDVECEKGRNDEKRWRFIPEEKDVGEYAWAVKILDSRNQVIGSAETRLIILPSKLKEAKAISLLAIGDSLTDASIYLRRVNANFQKNESITLQFVGSNGGRGRAIGKDGFCHEGAAGWSWYSFCEKWDENAKGYKAKSKFLVLENGEKKLDIKAYLEKYNKGIAPEFVTIMLGTNDIFNSDDDNFDSNLENIYKYMDRFLSALTEAAPDAKIGIALTPPPASSQDAFGANYGCGQTRWQFKRNQHNFVKALMDKFKNNSNKNISLIPVYINLDSENGFIFTNEETFHGSGEKITRECNGVHPSRLGYQQIGDSFTNWITYQLNRE